MRRGLISVSWNRRPRIGWFRSGWSFVLDLTWIHLVIRSRSTRGPLARGLDIEFSYQWKRTRKSRMNWIENHGYGIVIRTPIQERKAPPWLYDKSEEPEPE